MNRNQKMPEKQQEPKEPKKHKQMRGKKNQMPQGE